MTRNVMCKNCNNLKNHWCEKVIDSPDEDMERDCLHFQQKTKADRIRAMSDEELAKWMSGGATMSDSSCYYCKNNKLPYCDGTDCTDKSDADIILEWLQQPAEGE